MNLKYNFEDYRFEIRPILADEGGGFFISMPELPGCVSDGDTYETAIANAREAFDAWIASYKESGLAIPKAGVDSKPAKILLRLARSTHQELICGAAADGVSVNSHVSTLLAEAIGYRAGRNARERGPGKRESSTLESRGTASSGALWVGFGDEAYGDTSSVMALVEAPHASHRAARAGTENSSYNVVSIGDQRRAPKAAASSS